MAELRVTCALAFVVAAALPASSTGGGGNVVVGRSVEGRRIAAVDVGPDADQGANVLVVGSIHGDEPAGIAIARDLIAHAPPHTADLWVIPDLNPDGVFHGTRQNAHGVDLNRNFPWHWRRLGRRGDRQYSGTHPLSEPESRLAYRLIRRLKPRITIWFHQPLDVVDESGGDPALERRFARLARLRFGRLPRYPGSAASWQNRTLRGTSSFVVELPAGRLSARRAHTLAEAVLDLTGESPTT
jgi:protein MpaA